MRSSSNSKKQLQSQLFINQELHLSSQCGKITNRKWSKTASHSLISAVGLKLVLNKIEIIGEGEEETTISIRKRN